MLLSLVRFKRHVGHDGDRSERLLAASLDTKIAPQHLRLGLPRIHSEKQPKPQPTPTSEAQDHLPKKLFPRYYGLGSRV